MMLSLAMIQSSCSFTVLLIIVSSTAARATFEAFDDRGCDLESAGGGGIEPTGIGDSALWRALLFFLTGFSRPAPLPRRHRLEIARPTTLQLQLPACIPHRVTGKTYSDSPGYSPEAIKCNRVSD